MTKALNASPNQEAEHYRKLQVQRCEDMFLALQGGIQAGDPPAVNSGIKVLSHEAEILGIEGPVKLEPAGQSGNQPRPEPLKRPPSAEEKLANAVEVMTILLKVGGSRSSRGIGHGPLRERSAGYPL